MHLPSYEEIITLHQSLAPSDDVFAVNFTHSEIVRDIAMEIARSSNLSLDLDLVAAGSLLHDVGYYPILTKTGELLPERQGIEHGILGEQLLEEAGYPESLSRIASHHTGSGVRKDDIIRNNLPLPYRDFLAETNEEKLIMYADKFHSKHHGKSTFNTFAWYERYLEQFGEKNVATFRELAGLFGIPDVVKLQKLYGGNLRDI